MIIIKTPKNKLFTQYLNWLNPLLHLSKGEIDILAAMLTLHYAYHTKYDQNTLSNLLLMPETLEGIRKKMKINSRLFNKLVQSLKDKGLIEPTGLNPKLTNYPKNGKFRLFVGFEVE